MLARIAIIILVSAQVASAATFEVKDHARAGSYGEIRGTFAGAPLTLKLKRIPHYEDAGGFLVEQNPSYEVTGRSGAGAVKLDIELEDEIVNVGGVLVQTGTRTHVKGKVGKRTFTFTIFERERIENVGGINVQAETWREVVSDPTGAPAATLKAVDGHHVFAGSDNGKPFSVTIENWLTPQLSVSEGASTELVVALLGLRPFLNVTH